MAQREFTVEEAEATKEAIGEMFKAIPKSKRMGYLGHLNDVFLFIDAAILAIENETSTGLVKEKGELR